MFTNKVLFYPQTVGLNFNYTSIHMNKQVIRSRYIPYNAKTYDDIYQGSTALHTYTLGVWVCVVVGHI